MWRVFAMAGLVLCLTVAPQFSVTSRSEPQLEPADPHGGVLCIWGILSAAVAVGNMCFPDQDAELKATLRESIQRMDAFMDANWPGPKEGLGELKVRYSEQGIAEMIKIAAQREPGVDVCRTDGVRRWIRIYEGMRTQPLQSFRDGISSLLAVPRKPVWGVCL